MFNFNRKQFTYCLLDVPNEVSTNFSNSFGFVAKQDDRKWDIEMKKRKHSKK